MRGTTLTDPAQAVGSWDPVTDSTNAVQTAFSALDSIPLPPHTELTQIKPGP